MKINHLTSAEENLMKLFWELESFYLKDVMEQLPEPKPHQNTVSTYLKILVEKGYLATEKQGRIFRYSAIVPKEDYRKFRVMDLCEGIFDNSGKEILDILFKEKLISQQDLMRYFDLKIELKPTSETKPSHEFADDILKNAKKKKSKDKSKDKKKKK